MNVLDNIIKKIEKSEKWEELNKLIKELYVKEGKKPSSREYQAIRNMIIYKCILENEEIKDILCKETYNKYKRNEVLK